MKGQKFSPVTTHQSRTKTFKHLTHTFVFTTAAYTEKKSKIDGKRFLQVIFCYYLLYFYFCSTHFRPREAKLATFSMHSQHKT